VETAEIGVVLGNARREGRNWRCRYPLRDGCTALLGH
jgi:hypothetical protein